MTALYKDSTTFDFDQVVYDVSIKFGVSCVAMDKIHKKPATPADDIVCSKLHLKNPQLKSLHQLNGEFFKQHLHPGEEYNTMLGKLSACLNYSVDPERLPSAATTRPFNGGKVISLLEWIQGVFMDSGTRVLFGDQVQKLDPDLVDKFLRFDDDNWKLWYKWPGAGEMYAAKAQVIKTLQDYLCLPHHERPGASHLVQVIESSQRALGIPLEDIAANLAMMYWV